MRKSNADMPCPAAASARDKLYEKKGQMSEKSERAARGSVVSLCADVLSHTVATWAPLCSLRPTLLPPVSLSAAAGQPP